ncbi:Hypothetical predicted protein [Paramuricea clavata]|uniref:Major facilitator superfamily associated domain-containing protein n=1 Tax=Paramuricea clavata TaxID=317549 RepID=A0A6S7JAE2_PARCT|nr:Hypothetical predicted protein [Paramuricea clavata]
MSIIMVKFSLKAVALKWYFFSCPGSVGLFVECFNLFMKQLGFNPGQIGLTALFGIQHLLIPLCLLFGEKFRARKIVAVCGTLGASVCCMLPLLSLVVPALRPTCYTKPYIAFKSARKAIQLRNGTVHLNYSSYAVRSNKKHFTSTKSLKAVQQHIFINSSVDITANNPSAFMIHHTISHLPLNNPLKTVSVHSKNSNPTRTGITDSKPHHSKPYLTSTHTPSIQQASSRHNGQMFSKYSKQKTRLSVSKIHHSSKFNNTLSTQRIRRSSIPSNYSNNPAKPSSKTHNSQSSLSVLFLILIISRSLTQFFDRIDLSLANLATMTFIQGGNGSYGVYRMWTYIASALSIPCVSVLAWYIRINICGVEKYGYFIAFIWGGIMFLLSMLSLPWFKFEYEKKKFTWSRVKSDVFNAHYIFMFVVLFYAGLCIAFQSYWEFWYLDGLSASPLLIAAAGLVRRPTVAISAFLSTHVIRKIGELKTICVTMFLYACSYFALSFARLAWLVVVIDTSQAVALALNYCAFTAIFYNAASKENSSMILGLQETVYAVAFDAGSSLMGVLFHTLGTRLTLLIYSISYAVVLVMLVLYIRFSTSLHKYEKVAQDSDVE